MHSHHYIRIRVASLSLLSVFASILLTSFFAELSSHRLPTRIVPVPIPIPHSEQTGFFINFPLLIPVGISIIMICLLTGPRDVRCQQITRVSRILRQWHQPQHPRQIPIRSPWNTSIDFDCIIRDVLDSRSIAGQA